jgi:glycosyltransferase involved in cell wall biosynthesis
MAGQKLPGVALVWAQYADYHVDRCTAVAQRLVGRADVIAVELATASHTYAWEPAGAVPGARKVTLFPGAMVEDIPLFRRFLAQFRALRRCRAVFFGVGYNEPDVIVLSWLLRLLGVTVVMMTDSKFDDKPRRARFELFKQFVLLPYNAAIVAGKRQAAYVRMLGFRHRRVLPGYDVVSVERIRAQAARPLAPHGKPFAQRPFVFVGRFVEKKNVERLLDGFALYVAQAGAKARRLQLVGSGPLEAQLRRRVEVLGIADRVDFLGFRSSADVSGLMADGLALLLVSTVEQWGLVVNEALAVGLPVIVSHPVGARDLLVRNLVNGFTVGPRSPESMAEAMLETGRSETAWRAMVEASHAMAWLGDCERFADAVELVLFPDVEAAARGVQATAAALELA